MKKIVLSLFLLFTVMTNQAQVLNIKQCTQEQSEWCWAGISQSILDYYGYQVSQCEIADWTRTVSTWHDFGSVNCCDNPEGPCNYWNYNWGERGSIQEILIHFGEISNYGNRSSLKMSKIQTEVSNNRPFIIRWAWTSGGGHFVIGHGLLDQTVYYMDPWFGEGLKFASYNWMVNDGQHSWTHTNILTVSPNTTNVTEIETSCFKVYPNPTCDKFFIDFNGIASIKLYNILGQEVLTQNINNKAEINISYLYKGIYIMNVISGGKVIGKNKIVKQ